MDKIFGSAYRGDPGVPHSGPAPYNGIFAATGLYTTYLWFFPYYWHQFKSPIPNPKDATMVIEHERWKKALARGKADYEPEWDRDYATLEWYRQNWWDKCR